MATINYAVYKDATGQIVWSGSCDDSQLPTMGGTGLSAVQVANRVEPSLYYFPAGVLTLRPLMNISSVVQGQQLTLTGVPYGSIIRVLHNALLTVPQDDATGIVQFNFSTPGRYLVRVELFPYRDYIEEFRV